MPFGCRPSLVGRPMPAVALARFCDEMTGSLQTTTGLPRSASATCVGQVGLSTLGAGYRLNRAAHTGGPCLQEGRVNPVRPLNPADASRKASRMFNSTPTFPSIGLGYGCLRSLCVYSLFETPRLLATPRLYGTRRAVRAWSGWFRHLIHATSYRTHRPITAIVMDILPPASSPWPKSRFHV